MYDSAITGIEIKMLLNIGIIVKERCECVTPTDTETYVQLLSNKWNNMGQAIVWNISCD